jgi:hypothetical protein
MEEKYLEEVFAAMAHGGGGNFAPHGAIFCSVRLTAT